MPHYHMFQRVVGFPPRSLDLDGTTEFLFNNTDQSIGIVNDWSISSWVKYDAITSGDQKTLFDIGATIISDARLESTIFSEIQNNSGTQRLQALLYDTAEVNFKWYAWDNKITAGDWEHILFTWNGSTFLVYINGVDTATTSKFVNLGGTQSDRDRKVGWGTHTQSSGPDGPLGGNVAHLAIWNVALSAANVTRIFDDKLDIDLGTNIGDYDQSAALQHYWRQGLNDTGETDSAGSINFDDSVGISTADLSTDVP